MSTPIEARRLSGTDIGKTFFVAPDQVRTIHEVKQNQQGCWVISSTKDGRRWKNKYDPADTITVTGIPSPITEPSIGPDCRDKKHSACDGRALDEIRDEITGCICICHIH